MADQWQAVAYENGERHVVPIDDLRPHVLPDSDEDGPCWCHPFDDGGITVHNSLDKRELYERGERKPS